MVGWWDGGVCWVCVRGGQHAKKQKNCVGGYLQCDSTAGHPAAAAAATVRQQRRLWRWGGRAVGMVERQEGCQHEDQRGRRSRGGMAAPSQPRDHHARRNAGYFVTTAGGISDGDVDTLVRGPSGTTERLARPDLLGRAALDMQVAAPARAQLPWSHRFGSRLGRDHH